MKIVVTSILVDDQAKALAFYHYVLGFAPKEDVPMGRHRWLTLTSPDVPNGVELLLEPDDHPAAKAYKIAMRQDQIPPPHLRSRISRLSTPASAQPVSPSPNHLPTSARSPSPCSMTPAAT